MLYRPDWHEPDAATAAARLAPAEELRDLLVELIRANLDNDTNELMWGVPGTLRVAGAIGANDENEVELPQKLDAIIKADRSR